MNATKIYRQDRWHPSKLDDAIALGTGIMSVYLILIALVCPPVLRNSYGGFAMVSGEIFFLIIIMRFAKRNRFIESEE
jgi:hypothetical protein